MRRLQPWSPGTPCWLDVMTPDPEVTHRFYGGLFGWQFHPAGTGSYDIATLDGAAAAGVMTDRDHPAVWNLYLAVADVDGMDGAVREAGGEVLVPTGRAGGGRRLVAREPSGAVFCLWEAGDDIGCEIANEPGAFVWSELLSRDYPTARRFHEEVFGYGTWEISDSYTTIKVGDDVVGGIGAMPADYPDDVASHWRLYFAVTDVDAAVATAIELGATTGIEAHDTPFGRWAGLVDPLGARFCVITPPG